MRRLIALALTLTLLAAEPTVAATAGDIASLLTATGKGATSGETQAAWGRLADAGPGVVTELLTAMQGADPVAQNWLRACVDAICEEAAAGDDFPMEALRSFLADQSQSPRARRTAFEWITRIDPESKQPLLAGMLDDRSLDLRRDAVAQLLTKVDALPEDDDQGRYKVFAEAFDKSRDPKQLEQIAASLKELGQEVDLPGQMGFLKSWSVIGPFDNKGLEHYNTAYPPEESIDLAGSYDGKQGEVSWEQVTAKADGGFIDLVEKYKKNPESIAYAYTTFQSQGGEAEIRYQTKNATKVWLNGELVASHEVYHSGDAIDQYRTPVTLKAGENTLLVKVCQNEQRMPWEREWEFRLRVVDDTSTPVGWQ